MSSCWRDGNRPYPGPGAPDSPAPTRGPAPLLLLGWLWWSLLLVGCADDPQSPEEQIRAVLERAETAAEEHDVSTLRSILSERFEDHTGRPKDQAVLLLRGFLLRHRPLYIVTRIQSITVTEHQQAQVVLALATAGRPIDGSQESLGSIRGDLHRLELVMTRQDSEEWQVLRAKREPGGLQDFF